MALVLGASQYAGKICTVLFLAPSHDFILPDGYTATGIQQPDRWVLEFPRKVRAPLKGGGYRLTRYAVGIDRRLLPLRPGALEESERSASLPAPIAEVMA